MSDSSWQQAVLGELGVARRGLQALNTASAAAPGSDWGADSAPRAVAEPEPIPVTPDPLPAPVPAPPPSFTPVPEPAAPPSFAAPPAPPSFETPAPSSDAPAAASPTPAAPPVPPSFETPAAAAPAPPSFDAPVADAPAAPGAQPPGPPSFDAPAGEAPTPFAPGAEPPGPSFRTPAGETPSPPAPAPGAVPPGPPSFDAPTGAPGSPLFDAPPAPPSFDAPGAAPSGPPFDAAGPSGFAQAPGATGGEPVNAFAQPPAEPAQPVVINPYGDGAGGLQRDPFGDTPEPPAEPGPASAPQPAVPPLYNPDFDPEMAVAPTVGGAPGAPPPDAGSDEPESPVPSAPRQAPAQPQQQHGGVPMADDLVRKNQHGDPLMRRFGRAARKAVGATGPQDPATQAEIAALLQRAVPSYRQIAVASVRGGAGKTSMAALLATELARHRADRVIAMDADAELGSLPLRLGVRPEQSLFDLAARQPRTFDEAAQFLARTEAGLWVLSSTRGGRIAGEFTIETFQAALAAISRYFAAAVVDCGAGILTELHRGILGQTHGLVLVTPATADGALSARGALEWFAGNGQQALLSRTVIAMVTHAPQVGADLERAREMLAAWGLPIVLVPYDRHLAAGGSLDMTKIGEATRPAAGLIASEAFARALGGVGVVR
ncbi:CobQ/CobB/MinD/ParA nucleotide binding domain protein [Actinomadura rubteroloni]|uniref:CobQ/CobB/MinD/ParA nucleotide binding domain protein n=1 Tax=Actinomadura rubteroloni TaxID=1926885 RepID=A0A2P4UP58_9ACTN|nr:MinD/ParA family protein [Actinomadura rubteroloni]POM26837.1 CobQ/CobB/MinD/ParA nucleotide binding domain protein [Actinomadura rubteroloni]